MSKYRKRPIVVEARQWTGRNAAELAEWTGNAFTEIDPEDRGGHPIRFRECRECAERYGRGDRFTPTTKDTANA